MRAQKSQLQRETKIFYVTDNDHTFSFRGRNVSFVFIRSKVTLSHSIVLSPLQSLYPEGKEHLCFFKTKDFMFIKMPTCTGKLTSDYGEIKLQ